MRPYPATTPSPGYCCSCIPKSRQRCVTNLSISSKESRSSKNAIRSRADILPSARCFSSRCCPPPSSAARFIWRSCSMRVDAVTLVTGLLYYRYLRPVFQELLHALIRQGMLHQLIENLSRHGADIGPCKTGLHNVTRIPNGGDQNFGLEFVVIENRNDVANQIHTVVSDIIQAADKRTHKVSARFCSHDRLRCRKYESDIAPNAFIAERFGGFQAFLCHWALHHDVGMKLR